MNTIKKHNFGAGPCILPGSVLQQAAAAVINWDGMGLSILEVSHRSPEFQGVVATTQQLVRELLNVPENYSILFLQGGASTQFSMIPLNFLKGKTSASYLDSGYFAQKAIKEAKLFGAVKIVGSSKDDAYRYIPEIEPLHPETAYLHLTSNNTIEGIAHHTFPETSAPLICDMSSDIFSYEFDVSQFDLIYAGAQKNMGPAGMTMVIIKNEFMESCQHALPSMSDYKVFGANNSLYNTPPVFSIYVSMLNLLWLKEQGGVSHIGAINQQKAALLYTEIDRNPLFYGLADVPDRSRMNVTFKMYDSNLESQFLNYASDLGIIGIKGYRTVGGFRASMYNALPLASVEILVQAMQDFERTVIVETMSKHN